MSDTPAWLVRLGLHPSKPVDGGQIIDLRDDLREKGLELEVRPDGDWIVSTSTSAASRMGAIDRSVTRANEIIVKHHAEARVRTVEAEACSDA